MSTYYVNVFTGISLLMSVVTGYFFSESAQHRLFQ